MLAIERGAHLFDAVNPYGTIATAMTASVCGDR
mgnify:CR=1 FL=1